MARLTVLQSSRRSKFAILDRIYGGKTEGIKPEFSALMSDRWWLSLDGIRQHRRNREYERFRQAERDDYRKALEALNGNVELACAHWIIDRGGAIRFEGDSRWHYAYMTTEPLFRLGNFGQRSRRLRLAHAGALPNKDVSGLYVEAIDFSNRKRLAYDSFGPMIDLERLRFLKLRGSDVDDFALGRLGASERLAASLLYLDISRCVRVTERGIAAVVNLQALKKLDIRGCELVERPELLAALLESELTQLVVETDESPTANSSSRVTSAQKPVSANSGAAAQTVNREEASSKANSGSSASDSINRTVGTSRS